MEQVQVLWLAHACPPTAFKCKHITDSPIELTPSFPTHLADNFHHKKPHFHKTTNKSMLQASTSTLLKPPTENNDDRDSNDVEKTIADSGLSIS